MIHPLAEVHSDKIGQNTDVWQFSIILKGAIIGANCNINCHTFIENEVILGDNVTIKSGVYLWDGITIESDVFVGPNVTFTNDPYPRSKIYPKSFQKTLISHGASIGAAATILGGVKIGSYSMVGANALVTKDIPSRGLAIGNPAKVIGWLNEDGTKMKRIDTKLFQDNRGQIWNLQDDKIELK
ncbi:acyltransferase [Flavilitoribacter nigricans]|uniref:dTDP-6-deoxy-3,4-keto-hexulose isomerase n=1 Tax=Flavilitoribacter nigricans (strain ATCC 23147 / DSM 23189 / NBRC 102662 / NCIMB 1420 / SS-2) TaxID=1122177 RepID=A0A2D0N1A8_FLAN2|nr:acyltransferase [Flavilitoribacter nigricans]PHN01503.1 dTDP-6-deoxy-3,4-keto-hexulose isomerase [Flavilitoribacter nigricans DSM 23189 = NBRC 102662]